MLPLYNLLCFPLLFCLVLVFHCSASCDILLLPTTAPGEIILRPVACSAPHCWLTRNIYSIYSMQRGRMAQQLWICCAGFRQQSSGGGDLGVGGDTTVGSRDTLWQYGNVAIWQNCRMAIWQCGMDVYLVKNDRRNSRDTLRQKETKTDRQTDYHLSELKNDQ